jgi:hypothetical protein
MRALVFDVESQRALMAHMVKLVGMLVVPLMVKIAHCRLQ